MKKIGSLKLNVLSKTILSIKRNYYSFSNFYLSINIISLNWASISRVWNILSLAIKVSLFNSIS